MLNDDDRETIGLIVLAIVAGIIGYLSRALERKQHVKWYLCAVKGAASGLFGYLTMLAAHYYGLESDVTGIFVGLVGYVGADAVVPIFEKLVKRRLGIADENIFYPKYEGDERRVKMIYKKHSPNRSLDHRDIKPEEKDESD